MKKAYIVHGWDGYPEEGWFPWLKKELEAKGFEVVVPHLPNPGEPRIAAWVPKLKEVAGIPDEETYFIGHSMGCQTIVRYLEELPEEITIGGAVFVAGFLRGLKDLEDDDVVQSVANEWLTAPINLEAVRLRMPKSVAIFSDNDPYVPLDNKIEFEEKLGSKIVVEHAMGHFSGSTGTEKLPSVLKAVLDLSE